MTEQELIETLKLFEKGRVEQLPESARNLFYAIMSIADERDRLKEENYKLQKCLYEEELDVQDQNRELGIRIDKAIKKLYEICKIEDGNKYNNFQATYVFNNDERELMTILKGSDKG